MRANQITLMSGIIAAAYSHAVYPGKPKFTIHVDGVTSAGAGTAQIKVWASNKLAPSAANNLDWTLLATFDLVTSTTRVSGSNATDAPWAHVRVELVSISGTDGTVNAYMDVG